MGIEIYFDHDINCPSVNYRGNCTCLDKNQEILNVIILNKEYRPEPFLKKINELLKQLSPGKKHFLTLYELERAWWNGETYIFGAVARKGRKIELVGVGLLFFEQILYGYIAQIHDVVVDEKYRGRGLADMIVDYMMRVIYERQPVRVELTSGKSEKRAKANELWKKYGFVIRDSNPYIKEFDWERKSSQ